MLWWYDHIPLVEDVINYYFYWKWSLYLVLPNIFSMKYIPPSLLQSKTIAIATWGHSGQEVITVTSQTSQSIATNFNFFGYSSYSHLSISIHTYSWVDPLLWYGCRHTLEHSDLYAHPQELDAERLHKKFNRCCYYWILSLLISTLYNYNRVLYEVM